MTREEIREKTMQLVYQMDINGEFDYTKLIPIEENAKIMDKKQAVVVLEAIKEHIADIDSLIISNLDKWKPERVAKTDFAILRTAVAEILYNDELPNNIAINEAVEMAKKYGDSKSYAFVNSVLSKIDKSLK